MELVPIRVHAAPGSRATFTCSLRGHERLAIEFEVLGLGNRTGEEVARTGEEVARVRRAEGGGQYSWHATRQWSLEVEGQALVVCSLMDTAGRSLGRLQALVTSGAECSEECGRGECSLGGGEGNMAGALM